MRPTPSDPTRTRLVQDGIAEVQKVAPRSGVPVQGSTRIQGCQDTLHDSDEGHGGRCDWDPGPHKISVLVKQDCVREPGSALFVGLSPGGWLESQWRMPFWLKLIVSLHTYFRTPAHPSPHGG